MSLLDRARGLVARAAHPKTPETEARTCAVLACRLIQEHGLLDHHPGGPVREVREELVVLVDPLVLLVEVKLAYRFARITPESKRVGSSEVLVIAKEHVREIAWMSEAEKRARYGPWSSRVTARLVVTPNWRDGVRTGRSA